MSNSSNTTLHFYFDFISPYAYFAWRKIPELCRKYQLDLDIHPVVFGKLLDHWGQLGPAEIPPKRMWLAKYCLRYAEQNGFEYNPPKFHPYNSLPSLRMALKQVSGEDQVRVITRIFEAGWSEGEDLGNSDRLLEILRESGISCENFESLISDPAIKQQLKDETEKAIKQGVFGVPSIIINGELFWGNDQFEHIELFLEGKDPVDQDKIDALGNRERTIDRKAFSNELRSSS